MLRTRGSLHELAKVATECVIEGSVASKAAMRRIALLALLMIGCGPRVLAPVAVPIKAEPRHADLGVAGCSQDGDCQVDEVCTAGLCSYQGSPPSKKRVEMSDNTIAIAPEFNTEGYDHTPEAEFVAVADQPLSTFSADVDTASYSNVRRMLRQGFRPEADAVRIEEFLNYFNYAYPAPTGTDRFSVTTELGACPWNKNTELVRIGLRGEPLAGGKLPPRNLVFLLDVSGSMNTRNKLPLLKRSMQMLTRQLTSRDRIAIVVYAGASGLVLPSTRGDEHATIINALGALEAGGSTNGGEGIELAYKLSKEAFVKKGINRVILATDGDFNVGLTSRGELVRLIEKKRETGVSLTVLGFGEGNLKDSSMEQLADKGNGNYAYIDSLLEARKVLVEQAGGTFKTIAKDVKLQVEFNPAKVAEYRLIGYMNRRMAAEDFKNDKKDAGEIGADHRVTALYEIRRVKKGKRRGRSKLRYQGARKPTAMAKSDELMNLKIRFKKPRGDKSREIAFPVAATPSATPTEDFRFASAVAAFGLKLRKSDHTKKTSFDAIHDLAAAARGTDRLGLRGEFLELIKLARDLPSED